MNVAIRADASVELGAGHVMRCLALADELRARGAAVRFLGRRQPGDLCDLVVSHGYPLGCLAGSVVDWRDDADACLELLATAPRQDWLVVDHYGLDARWERALRARAARILAIDDLADRAHDCDLLLDQNLKSDTAYAGLVPAGCVTLIGPRHALLRAEFRRARAQLRPRADAVRRLLVLFGGSDPLDLSGMALDALDRIAPADLTVDVVVGAAYPHFAALQARCAGHPRRLVHRQADNVAELMMDADLALGAAGISTWERACLGLPSLVVTFAENQRPIARAARDAGLLTWVGDAADMNVVCLAAALAAALDAPERRRGQRQACLALVDGAGCARVAEAMGA